MKGDRVRIIYKLGVTGSAEHVVEADAQGRTIDIEHPMKAVDQYVQVRVRTRGGTIVREDSFARAEVIAVIDERKSRGDE